ncbi:hypothetical protein MA16_Dca011982 [Dendrobium catenatum]|uniref:Uncharacterized protein n=1 Tax=Dendrobium catenatum TaxID=906689 RepID=A0A2I0WDW0_9ASPA|nr:hypothetical protein MA16_Dca011982 [Dendrobium catenatum]
MLLIVKFLLVVIWMMLSKLLCLLLLVGLILSTKLVFLLMLVELMRLRWLLGWMLTLLLVVLVGWRMKLVVLVPMLLLLSPVLFSNCVEVVNVAASVGVSHDVISPELNLAVDPKCNEGINSLVDVPVNVVHSHFAGNFLGDVSGSNVRNNLNWLESSEGELGSDSDDDFIPSPEFCGGSDPGFDFNLVNVRPVSVVGFRGRARGRGRGRRRR